MSDHNLLSVQPILTGCAANPDRIAAKQTCFAVQPVKVGCTSGFPQILSGPTGLLWGEHVSGHTAGG